MGLSFFLWASACYSGARFGLCGKTIASLRRNVVTELLPKLQAMAFPSGSGGRRTCCR